VISIARKSGGSGTTTPFGSFKRCSTKTGGRRSTEKQQRAQRMSNYFPQGLAVILRCCYLLTTTTAVALESVVTFPQRLAEFKHVHFGCRENMQVDCGDGH
jgi:hypothetical protein